MTHLLDTDIIIDFFNKKEPGFSLIQKVSQNKLIISVIGWIELCYGIEKIQHAKDRKKDLEGFIESLSIQIQPINEVIASRFVRLKIELEKQGTLLTDFDIMIAATTIEHDAILVTRNIKHFQRIKELKIYL